jgi:Crinkler effector protein N-terminal domain
MVKLFCALVGEKGNSFSIKIDASESVDDLKVAIKQRKERTITCDADNLKLFLGKKSGVTWLDSKTDVNKLKNGEMNEFIKELTHEAKELQGESGIKKVLKGMLEPTTDQIHILVIVPKQETSTLIIPSVLQERQTIITLFCTVVGQRGSAFAIEVDINKTVDALKDAIAVKRKYDFAADMLQLFLGKTSDDTWLDSSAVDAVTLNGDGNPEGFAPMNPLSWINNPNNFGENFQPHEGKIHVLVVVPEVDQGQWGEERARKKARTRTIIEVERMNSIAATLDIVNWQIGGIELDIHQIESDFPKWFYVRKETKDIINIFLESKLSIVLVGSPGVGKSMLVVLFAFHKALRQEKVVVLLRSQKTLGLSMLYLDGKNKEYWRKDKVEVSDLTGLSTQDFELCLDCFTIYHFSPVQNSGNLESFRLFATSAQYDLKNDEVYKRTLCLVPFWSKSNLNNIGGSMGWNEIKIDEQYYYSGGNLRDFLSESSNRFSVISPALSVVCPHTAALLDTQFGMRSPYQVDRLQMTAIKLHSKTIDSRKYLDCGEWFSVITSEYALRKLGNIVTPSYYKILWSKSRMLGDDVLMGIAFENYVHTMARDGQTLKLQVRDYDRIKSKDKHTYSTLEFKANSYLFDGNDAEACDVIMQRLKEVEYWYPYMRTFKSIDSVGKRNINGEHKEVALFQITKSDNHKIDSVALDRYADMFSEGVKYIALVPDKETSDKF